MKNQNRSGKIRVMIVDDHPVMRNALRTIISLESDFVVAAEAESGPAAIDSLARVQPDVVLMDGSMPEMSGMEAARRLRELRPDLKIIGLTLYEQTSYLEEMIAVGASGYVLKTGSPSDIVEAVRTVARGGTYFDPSIPRRASGATHEPTATAELTAQELAVAKCLANGRTKAEIAESLGKNLSEIEAGRKAAMAKLGLRSRAELVRVAKKSGWLET
jgi:two-component system, NarL family, response regulator NreC